MQKILYFGGQKSGKSALAQQKALEIAQTKPYYIATYDNSYGDSAMQKRIDKHKQSRRDDFITLEVSKNLHEVIQPGHTYLIDCLSMWLLHNLASSQEQLTRQLEQLARSKANIIFVLNDVSSGVIPPQKLSREYVDKSGIIGQKVASFCDKVYEVKLGIGVALK
ncbi:MAG: bifunctional adenosylcobinamide kinase/adenosylcobinamide-phosphate guanylyltransferase [Campylobacterota bacterium]